MNSYNGFSPTQRNRALRWLRAEEAAGRRARPTSCLACGQTEGLISGHSEDYSAPFGDHTGRFGLCYRCHMMVHSRFSAPWQFSAYASSIDAGIVWPAIERAGYGPIQNMLRMDPLELVRVAQAIGRDRGDQAVMPLLLWRIRDGEFRP